MQVLLYAFVALGRPGSRRGRIVLLHHNGVKHMVQSSTSSIHHNDQYRPILQVVIKVGSAKLIALV